MIARFTHILVPTDFGPAAGAALLYAKELAQRFGARVSLLHVVTDPTATGTWTPELYVPATAETRDRFLRTARERLEGALTAEEREKFRVTNEVRIGAAADNIQEVAREQQVDLIVMGTHGRRGLAHMFLGSVAERVVRGAPCPVLTTHAEPEAAAANEVTVAALA